VDFDDPSGCSRCTIIALTIRKDDLHREAEKKKDQQIAQANKAAAEAEFNHDVRASARTKSDPALIKLQG
jgi:hypothetical protein